MGEGVIVKNEDDVAYSKPIYIFGRNVSEIKCFRKSFIFGICSGIVGGLACFLGTSKARFSSHIGFVSLWCGVFAYWFPCRYKYESQQMVMEIMKNKRNNMNNDKAEES